MLGRNTPLDVELGDIIGLPVKASTHIYQGAALSLNSAGYANPLTLGEDFIGIADEEADNSIGSAGATTVSARQQGKIWIPSISGATAAKVNDPVYASADDTFSMSANDGAATPTAYTLIGYLRKYSSEACLVELKVKEG
jgi:hypothetical protein